MNWKVLLAILSLIPLTTAFVTYDYSYNITTRDVSVLNLRNFYLEVPYTPWNSRGPTNATNPSHLSILVRTAGRSPRLVPLIRVMDLRATTSAPLVALLLRSTTVYTNVLLGICPPEPTTPTSSPDCYGISTLEIGKTVAVPADAGGESVIMIFSTHARDDVSVTTLTGQIKFFGSDFTSHLLKDILFGLIDPEKARNTMSESVMVILLIMIVSYYLLILLLPATCFRLIGHNVPGRGYITLILLYICPFLPIYQIYARKRVILNDLWYTLTLGGLGLAAIVNAWNFRKTARKMTVCENRYM